MSAGRVLVPLLLRSHYHDPWRSSLINPIFVFVVIDRDPSASLEHREWECEPNSHLPRLPSMASERSKQVEGADAELTVRQEESFSSKFRLSFLVFSQDFGCIPFLIELGAMFYRLERATATVYVVRVDCGRPESTTPAHMSGETSQFLPPTR
jgi:hypothetical protein